LAGKERPFRLRVEVDLVADSAVTDSDGADLVGIDLLDEAADALLDHYGRSCSVPDPVRALKYIPPHAHILGRTHAPEKSEP
jgi:hypothetical protein